jgi:hypothetical protein
MKASNNCRVHPLDQKVVATALGHLSALVSEDESFKVELAKKRLENVLLIFRALTEEDLCDFARINGPDTLSLMFSCTLSVRAAARQRCAPQEVDTLLEELQDFFEDMIDFLAAEAVDPNGPTESHEEAMAALEA